MPVPSTVFPLLKSHRRILVKGQGLCQARCIDCWWSAEWSYIPRCPNGDSSRLRSMDLPCSVVLFELQAGTYLRENRRAFFDRLAWLKRTLMNIYTVYLWLRCMLMLEAWRRLRPNAIHDIILTEDARTFISANQRCSRDNRMYWLS